MSPLPPPTPTRHGTPCAPRINRAVDSASDSASDIGESRGRRAEAGRGGIERGSEEAAGGHGRGCFDGKKADEAAEHAAEEGARPPASGAAAVVHPGGGIMGCVVAAALGFDGGADADADGRERGRRMCCHAHRF
ncbi:hypothetical protein U9M48_032323 [Paspalum notatum var. saurae]|uniref:Uncharacterized protein n=1 Tax=Paspalum notatum var. saurae TaxID=547442 RepID=A0AAQ3U7J4_PASNO